MDDVWRILGDPAADGTMSAIWCAAKATGVLAGAGLASLALGRKAAAARHLVWALGLAGAIAVLPLAVALPRWRIPLLESPARPEPAAVSKPEPAAVPAVGPGEVGIMLPPSSAVPPVLETSPLNPLAAEPSRMAWPLLVWA